MSTPKVRDTTNESGYLLDNQLVSRLLFDGSWIERRITTVEVQEIEEESYHISRRISLSVGVDRLQELVGEPLPSGTHVALPVGLFRKDLLLDFSLRDAQGGSLPILSRQLESEAALTFALSTVKEPLGDEAARLALKKAVSSLKRSKNRTAADVLETIGAVSKSKETKAWTKAASKETSFTETVKALLDHHICIVIVPVHSSNFILKIHRQEQVPRRERDRRLSYPKPLPLQVDIADYGWAISDHLRVFAPTGTDVTDTALYALRGGTLPVWIAKSPGKTAAYVFHHDGETKPGHVRLEGLLRPTRWPREWAPFLMLSLMIIALASGSIWEMLVLRLGCGYGLFETVSQNNLEVCHGPLWDTTNIEPIVTLTSLVATVSIALVFRQDEHPVRSELLAKWRRDVFLGLSFAWVAGAVLIAPRAIATELLLWLSWLILAVAMGLWVALKVFPAYRVFSHNEKWAEHPLWRIEIKSEVTSGKPR